MSRYIYNLIDEGEHLNQDFKFEISDARKIARTLSAFSNTSGGKLLIGVKDNGRIAGIRSEEEYYMLDAAATLYCKPEIVLNYKKWDLEGKTILEVDVPEGQNKPYYCKTEDNQWKAFIRIHDENHLANVVQLNVWKYEKKERGVYLQYTETEEQLMHYLRNHNGISLEDFCTLAAINRKKATTILSKLAGFGLIRIDYRGTEAVYLIEPGS